MQETRRSRQQAKFGLSFDREQGGDMFLQNTGLSPNYSYIALQTYKNVFFRNYCDMTPEAGIVKSQ
jgi:hypothetical protein